MADSSGNWILPVGVAVVLGFGGLWAISQNRTRAEEDLDAAARAAEADNVPKPFGDMPPEEPPEGSTTIPFGASAKNLADNPAWKQALELAAEAETHFAAAEEAIVAGDRTKLNEEGKRAQTLFDQALETTAEWEEKLLATYGETDPEVRAIKKQRSKWFDRIRWLHKSIAR